jgi:hypothetical protein
MGRILNFSVAFSSAITVAATEMDKNKQLIINNIFIINDL